MIRMKRAWDEPDAEDGLRILVDRLWPRGMKREKIDLWMKEVAPSPELRKWFGHDPARWEEFRSRYFAELEHSGAARELLLLVGSDRKITLIYAASDREHNNAAALLEYILEHGGAGK
ncbi:MAG: DUF488 family protein [Burkholderiales bacterium]|nr:DUF488 family protein [Burkholderiales bacterium]